MKDLLSYSTWLNDQAALALVWLNDNVIAWSTLIQCGIILLVFLAARVLAKRSTAWVKTRLENRNRKSVLQLHVSMQEIFLLSYVVLLLWFAVGAAQGAQLHFNALKIVASLVAAWAVIRFTSSTIKSVFWSRLIAITLWVIAALNIVGWLEGAINMLGNAAITVGNFNLSLLFIIKSLLAFVVLFWAIGSLSGLLERSFSKAKGLTPSQRVLFYKFSNIALYIAGGLVGLNIVGLDLTALTVFSGALGLGIGFGLQKVFANLISGIILLLDKSVKPGDVIAVGDTFGWVNSLGARCVSVLTRDGKEHLIPNENLISEQVENWSYSKKNIRIHIPVGVAYGSDIYKVKELLLQAVSGHSRILKYPAPVCLIKGFGDSAIDHEIRAWIDDPEAGISNVKSDIYYSIHDLFKEHGIEIPFPQRDVHLKPDMFERIARIMHQETTEKETSHEVPSSAIPKDTP